MWYDVLEVSIMLQIFLSSQRKQNTKLAFQKVCEPLGEGIQKNYFIVPEQFSHMYERELCRVGGDDISLRSEILGFSRLAVRVFSEIGGIADSETDAAGRLLMMSLTMEQLRSRLKLYGGKALKPSFLLQLSDTVEELRSFCIQPDSLRQGAARIGGSFAVKLEELALIMEGYDSVCANVGQNPESRLNRLLSALQNSDFSSRKAFYFDGFTDFNGVELQIIEQLLKDGAEVSVFLLCDELNTSQQQFMTAAATGRRLVSIAKGAETAVRCIPLENSTPEQGPLRLRKELFYGMAEPLESSEGLEFLEAPSVIDECRFAAGEILKLLEQGNRLRDITLACADYGTYEPVLRTILRRADIPAYFAGDTDILQHPVVHMLLSALEAARGLEQSAVIEYMKCGFCKLSMDRRDRLENYILTWNLSGRRFEQEWAMDPDGIQLNDKKKPDSKLLEELNESRVILLSPLLRLRNGLRQGSNTGEMVLALDRFMEDIQLNEGLYAAAEEMIQRGELQKAQQYAQVYSVICTLMEQIHGILGETIRDGEEFALLFRTAVGLCSIGTIPATLDCVSVGSLSAQRRSDTDYLFILGANEGVFPAAQGNQSLLSDRERMELQDIGIELSPGTSGRLDRELAMIDSVLESPRKALFLGSTAGKGSYYYVRARQMFPNSPVVQDDEALILRSERDYRTRFASPVSYKPEDLPAETVEALYGNPLRLSSSKIEKLASCRFKYFLEYGLGAKERKTAEVDASLYGTFVHHVLENTGKQVKAEGGFHKLPLSRVLEIATEHMEYFTEVKLKELWSSERSEHLFRRNYAEVYGVVRELYEELSAGKFEPEWFELRFSDKPKALPLIRMQAESVTVDLEGSVDRADLFRYEGRLFVRVIDYKTGKTTFDHTKVYHGLGMQMLLYLFAVCSNGQRLKSEPLYPAGVLYFPARVERESLKNRRDYLEQLGKPAKPPKRSGLIYFNEDIMDAMDPSFKYSRLPCTCSTTGKIIRGSFATQEQFTYLRKHVVRKVKELADDLYSGAITPEPYYVDESVNGCSYCPYGDICRNKSVIRPIETLKAEEFWQLLEGRGQDG